MIATEPDPVIGAASCFATTGRFAVPIGAPPGTMKEFVQTLGSEDCTRAFAEDPPMLLRSTLTLVTFPKWNGSIVTVRMKPDPGADTEGLTEPPTIGAPRSAGINAKAPALYWARLFPGGRFHTIFRSPGVAIVFVAEAIEAPAGALTIVVPVLTNGALGEISAVLTLLFPPM